MNQNPNLQEPVQHGSIMFPLEYYHCIFPLSLSGLPVHWHEEFEITLVRKGSCTYQIDLQPYLIREGVQSYFDLHHRTLPSDAFSHIQLEDGYRKGGYGCYDEEILSCIRHLFLQYGVPLDPTYTGKGFLGMLHYLKEHQITEKKILFLHTGGTPLFYDALNAGLLNTKI